MKKQFIFKGMVAMLMAMPIIEVFCADHGFMLYIWDKQSKTTIFSGCVNRP